MRIPFIAGALRSDWTVDDQPFAHADRLILGEAGARERLIVLFDTNIVLDVLLNRDRHARAATIITRNAKDFARSTLRIIDPRGVLEAIGASDA